MEAGVVLVAIDAIGRLLVFVQKSRENAAKTGEWSDADKIRIKAKYQEQIVSKAFLTDEEGG